MYTLKGHRIHLRPLRLSDLGVFLEYRSDPAVCRYQGFEVFDRAMAVGFLQQQSQMPLLMEGDWVNVAVADAATDALLGDVAVHGLDKHPQLVELGYTIHPAQQGKGYAKEALQVLLQELFLGLSIHKAIAEVDPRNEPSWRLLEALGFRREGHLKEGFFDEEDGTWVDEYLYGLLAREFLSDL